MSKPTFQDICNTAAAVRCKQAGQPTADIARSAGKSAGTVKRWIKKAGYQQRGGKLRHVSEALVTCLVEAPLRTLRDLQAMPDDQLYLCADASVAQRHKLTVPFECGCRQWVGAGVVRIEFYSKLDAVVTGTRFQDSDYAGIRTLEPIAGKTWQFDVLPSF